MIEGKSKLDTIHSNLANLFLGLILFSFLVSLRITNLLIILFAVNMLIWMFSKKWEWTRLDWILLIVIFPWVVEAISLLYTNNVSEGLHLVEKKLSLILFPFLILHGGKFYLNKINNLLFILFLSVLLITGYCVSIALVDWFQNHSNDFYWYDFTKPIGGYHPSYLSLIINFLTIWLFTQLRAHNIQILKFKYSQPLILLSIIYFGIIILLLSSKIHVVVYFVVTATGLMLVLNGKGLWIQRLFFLSIISFALFIFRNNLTKRFESIANTTYTLDAPVGTFNELTIRFALLECSYEIIKTNPIIGVGAGDVMEELDKVYREVDYKFGYLDKQDPHNQYVRILLGTGSIGLLFFLGSLITPLVMGVRRSNTLLFGFLVIFSVSFLFESILERHNGIIIYSILSSVIYFGLDDREEIAFNK